MRPEVYDRLEPALKNQRESEGTCPGRIEGVLMRSLPVTEGTEEATLSGVCKYVGNLKCSYRGKEQPFVGDEPGKRQDSVYVLNTCAYEPVTPTD